jgi:DNA-binding transcriptional LysR family regulator
MTLTKLKYFLEVARCKSFTKAANNLFIAQPALSKCIRQFEEEIGVQVFERTKRKVELTPAGELLFEKVDGMPQMIENAFEQARAIGRNEKGRVSIGILDGQEMSHVLMARMQQYSEQYPQYEVSLERNGFSKLRTGLLNGYYDAILTMSFDVEDMEEVTCQPVIKQTGGAIIINGRHPLAAKEKLTLYELKDENFIAISKDESPNGYENFLIECRSHGFEPHVTRTFQSLESVLLSVEAGIGIAILDRNTRLERNSDVRTYNIPESSERTPDFCVAWLKGNSSAAVRDLVDVLAE